MVTLMEEIDTNLYKDFIYLNILGKQFIYVEYKKAI